MSTRQKRLLKYGLFFGILLLVYSQGWHKPIIATLQRGILKTGIMNPQLKEVPDMDTKTRVKGTQSEAVAPGDPADLNVQFFDENDQLVSLADMPKQPYFINFWATWCVPCRKELPTLDTYYAIQQKHGLRVFAITTEGSVPIGQLTQSFQGLDDVVVPDGTAIPGDRIGLRSETTFM